VDRRACATALLSGWALPWGPLARAAAGEPGNVLRVASEAAETGFDPVQVSDLYSARVNAHIFEAPYRYDLFAVPVRARPLTAAELPQVSSDYRVWTVRLQRGIFFAQDPAFGGRRRELTAQDYVYTLLRYFDPATKSPGLSGLLDEGIEGLDERRDDALRGQRAFDYDTPVSGLRALDRYTLQIRLTSSRPRFLDTLCSSSSVGAMAREVVEYYGADIMAHPVGTGPYRLKQWRRSSRIVLERSPDYRDVRYDGQPDEHDAQGQAWLARFKGRRLPLNDGVEISVLEEGQSRWLSFLNGQLDIVRVPPEFTNYATPNGVLAPNLAKRGMVVRRFVNPDFTMSWFNMEDPVVGGYGAPKVALRRAIGLAYDIDREIRIVRRGAAVVAQATMPPGTYGYDAHYRSDNSAFDPARAKGLLDTFGYVDRDGDGWREQPDGQPLVLRMATQGSQIERQFDENWQRSLQAVGLKIRFETAQWPENLKAARAGRLQMWSLGSTSGADAQPGLGYMYGPSSGSRNLARFKLPAFDAIYERMLTLPDGPQRAALFLEASKLVSAYMPYHIHVHRVYADINQPWATGWRQAAFRDEGWQFVDVDAAARERLSR